MLSSLTIGIAKVRSWLGVPTAAPDPLAAAGAPATFPAAAPPPAPGRSPASASLVTASSTSTPTAYLQNNFFIEFFKRREKDYEDEKKEFEQGYDSEAGTLTIEKDGRKYKVGQFSTPTLTESKGNLQNLADQLTHTQISQYIAEAPVKGKDNIPA